MILTVVYVHRLKINHDSHEFILESGTVANSLFLTWAWASPGRRPWMEKEQRLLHGQRGNRKGIKEARYLGKRDIEQPRE
jgi:hypothetical protein